MDELYLQRAYELAARGMGDTWPNPPVGALVVRDGAIVGEGYHHQAGGPHAETNALRAAGSKARGAAIYISLEPCRHTGRTPPCTQELVKAGVARVIAGTRDPSGRGGADELRASGIEVVIANDIAASELIEIFARATDSIRPYVALKMAMSLDGAVASRPGVQERIGSPEEERYVRELRIAYDAVLVGAATVRIDDPRLTVRPPHYRPREYTRIVACGSASIPVEGRIFAAAPGYAKTIVLAPAGLRERFRELHDVAEVLFIGAQDAVTLDLVRAMKQLRARGLFSILCEGGPTIASGLLAAGQVDRVYWGIAPRFLRGDRAVPVLSGAELAGLALRLRFDRVERAGDDVIISGTCLAES